MADPNPIAFSLPFGTDFELSENGSLKMVSGVEKFRQRVIRRYFTNPAERISTGEFIPSDYLFDPEYGLGATRLVGEPTTDDAAARFRRKLRQAIFSDEGTYVDTSVEPEITLFSTPAGAVWARAKVYLLNTSPIHLDFQLNRNLSP